MFASDPSFSNMDIDTSSSTPTAGPSQPLATPLPPTTSISDLRKRLAGKLAGFRSKRGLEGEGANGTTTGNGADGEDSDDTTSRDALEAESRRRRGEMRDKRRRDRKEQRRAEKAQHAGPSAADRKKGQDAQGKGKDQALKNVPTAKTQLIVPQHGHGSHGDSLTLPHIALPSGSKPGKYTKGSAPTESSSNGASSHFKHLSNPAHALANLQKHDQHLSNMPDDKRAEAVEQERWAKALHRAEGGKIVDSEKILKKAVKRVEKTKSKSGKEWSVLLFLSPARLKFWFATALHRYRTAHDRRNGARIAERGSRIADRGSQSCIADIYRADRKKQLSDAQAAAIKKRNDNIAGRAQARKDKKSGVKKKDVKKVGGAGAKKGKSRPGFEGKKGGDKGKKGGK